MSIGLPSPASRGRRGGELLPGRGFERRDGQPLGLARVGREDAGTAGVGQDRDAPAARDRLVRQQGRDIEELFEGLRADHAGLPEERVDDGVALRQRARVRRRGPRAGPGAAGLDRHDGLRPGDAPRDAREESGRAEALEVKEDHVGARVLRPELEQVVARDVGLVADRDEARDAEVQASRAVEERESRERRSARRGRLVPREGRRERTSR